MEKGPIRAPWPAQAAHMKGQCMVGPLSHRAWLLQSCCDLPGPTNRVLPPQQTSQVGPGATPGCMGTGPWESTIWGGHFSVFCFSPHTPGDCSSAGAGHALLDVDKPLCHLGIPAVLRRLLPALGRGHLVGSLSPHPRPAHPFPLVLFCFGVRQACLCGRDAARVETAVLIHMEGFRRPC